MAPEDWTITGHAGPLAGRAWPAARPGWQAVLVPGYADHIGRYTAVAEALVAAGATVVGHDPAGHGRSAGPRGRIRNFESIVDDLHAVLLATRQELPTVLIGHSLGGTIVTRFAQRYPELLDALVLAAPILGTWPGLDMLAGTTLPDRAVDPDLLSRDSAVAVEFRADPLVWHGPFDTETLLAIDEALRTIDFDHPLGDDLPALWLHGAEDEIAPVADTRAGMDRIRGLRFTERIYPGARHDVFHEINAAEVLADLTGFVSDSFKTGPPTGP